MTVSRVNAGPRKIAYTTTAEHTPQELFALAADPRHHGELDGSGSVGDIVDGPDRVKTGDTFTMRMKMFGLPYRMTSTVTEVVENRVVEWRHPLGHRWRWEFEPADGGGTRITETLDYSTVPGIVARLLELGGVPRMNSNGIRRTLEQLGHTSPSKRA